jgi:hypothetical protein
MQCIIMQAFPKINIIQLYQNFYACLNIKQSIYLNYLSRRWYSLEKKFIKLLKSGMMTGRKEIMNFGFKLKLR